MRLVDFKKILRYLRGKEWELMIAVSFFLFLFLIPLNIYFFRKISKESSKPVSKEINLPSIRRNLLQRVLDDLAEKEKRFDEGFLTKPDIADPSI